jgi:predicted DNA-binding transcriptional regulator AlpA
MRSDTAIAEAQPIARPAPLLADHADTSAILGISQSHLHALKAEGKFGPATIRLGRCCRHRISEIEAWLAAGCPPRARWQAITSK